MIIIFCFFTRHGDMLYLIANQADVTMMDTSQSTSSGEPIAGTSTGDTKPANGPRHASISVVEDEVDQYLQKLDGKIPRKRNEQLWVVIYLFFNLKKNNFIVFLIVSIFASVLHTQLWVVRFYLMHLTMWSTTNHIWILLGILTIH